MIHDVAIRAATISDLESIVDVVVDAGLFEESQTVSVRSLLSTYFASQTTDGARAVVDIEDDAVVGVAYCQQKAGADGVWDLTMLAVAERAQGVGRGAALMQCVERDVRRRAGRIVLIETSASAAQARARRLYERSGYAQAAQITNYWEPGDDLVLYVKHL